MEVYKERSTLLGERVKLSKGDICACASFAEAVRYRIAIQKMSTRYVRIDTIP